MAKIQRQGVTECTVLCLKVQVPFSFSLITLDVFHRYLWLQPHTVHSATLCSVAIQLHGMKCSRTAGTLGLH